eukprot:2400126-Rhodomonas_salina.1
MQPTQLLCGLPLVRCHATNAIGARQCDDRKSAAVQHAMGSPGMGEILDSTVQYRMGCFSGVPVTCAL